MRLRLVLSGDLQFRVVPVLYSPLPPVPVLRKVCCPPYSYIVHSKANVRDSVTPYFSLFYSRTSAGTGGLCKAKRVEGERRGEGVMANGMDGVVLQFPLGKWVYFILFYNFMLVM